MLECDEFLTSMKHLLYLLLRAVYPSADLLAQCPNSHSAVTVLGKQSQWQGVYESHSICSLDSCVDKKNGVG